MAENDTENFALGLIVAALIYFIFRKQIDTFAANAGVSGSGGRGGSAAASGGGCGCDSPCSARNKPGLQLPSTNPGISIGGQSYSDQSFGSSSVRN